MYTIRLVLFCAFFASADFSHAHTLWLLFSLEMMTSFEGVVQSQRKIRARKIGCRKLKEEDCCGVLDRCDGDGFLGGQSS